MKRTEKIRELLKHEDSLSPQQAASILGCQPEEVHHHVTNYWLMNGRKKFRIADVLAKRDRMLREQTETRRRNNRLVRQAAR